MEGLALSSVYIWFAFRDLNPPDRPKPLQRLMTCGAVVPVYNLDADLEVQSKSAFSWDSAEPRSEHATTICIFWQLQPAWKSVRPKSQWSIATARRPGVFSWAQSVCEVLTFGSDTTILPP